MNPPNEFLLPLHLDVITALEWEVRFARARFHYRRERCELALDHKLIDWHNDYFQPTLEAMRDWAEAKALYESEVKRLTQ